MRHQIRARSAYLVGIRTKKKSLQKKVFKNFKEKTGAGWSGLKGSGSWNVAGVFGGTLLGAIGPGFVMFWDWESGDIVRRIDVDAKDVRPLSYD